VPLVFSMLELAGGTAEAPSQVYVGDPIPLPQAAGTAERTTVIRPDGSSVTLPPGAASFEGDLQPGIYFLKSGPRSFRVGANVPASESRTEPLPADELERYGAPGPKNPSDEARNIGHAALLRGEEAESRQKLWRWLLAAAFAVLLAESALAGWTERGSRDSVARAGRPT